MKQTSIFSYVMGNSNNSESVNGIEQRCSNVQEAPSSKRTKCDKTVKVRKWDKTKLKYGFFLPQPEELHSEFGHPVKRLSNSALVPAELQRHLEADRPAYETKTYLLL